MKVQVIVKNTSKATAADIAVDAIVRAADTAVAVQERVAAMTNTFSFPDQKLLFKGKVLSDGQRLSDCGIKEGDVLEFSYSASEITISQQLSDLLGERAVAQEELGLLYSYRFGLSVEDALKALGYPDCKLQTFLESQKRFSFEGGLVKSVQAVEQTIAPPPGLCPIEENTPHGPIEVKVSVEVHVSGKAPEVISFDDNDDGSCSLRLEAFDTVAGAKKLIAASEQVPFPARDLLFRGKKLEDGASLHEAGVRSGDLLVLAVLASEACLVSQLADLLRERAGLSPNELGLLYCQRFGTPVCRALRLLRLPGSLRRFLEDQARFSIAGGCVTLVDGPKLAAPPRREPSALDRVVGLLSEASFLNVDRVEKGSGLGGESAATVFVKGLPPSCPAPLLAALQKAVAFGLDAMLAGGMDLCSVSAAGDALEVRVGDSPPVALRLAAAPSCFQ